MPGGDGTGPTGGGPGTRRGRGFGQGRGMGRMGGPRTVGPEGFCVCAGCGHKVPHESGVPCAERKCPRCGGAMTRG